MSEQRQKESRPSRGPRGRGGYRKGGRRDDGPRDGRFRSRRPEDPKIQKLIRNAQDMLSETSHAVCLEDLNAYERKRIHQFFDNKADFETKTYRNGEEYLLWIFPVSKLRQYAQKMANEALQTGEEVDLPHMSNYERFIIHDALKDVESVETNSFGEGDERHIRITPVRFGRRLKKIVKKLKIF